MHGISNAESAEVSELLQYKGGRLAVFLDFDSSKLPVGK